MVKNNKPDRRACGIGPFHPMPQMRLDVQIVSRFHYQDIVHSFNPEPGASLDDQDELILLLIVPERLRRRVPPRYDALDPHPVGRDKRFEEFIRQCSGDVIE
jgi:hypothetical protein